MNSKGEEMPLVAEVILPLAVGKPYTFLVPKEIASDSLVGKRVEVQFGKKRHYSGLVIKVYHQELNEGLARKSILKVLDLKPLIQKVHIDFWEWMASYYCCVLGEIMIAAMPSGLKLTSDTIIEWKQGTIPSTVSDEEYQVLEALNIRKQLALIDVASILNTTKYYGIVQSLLDQELILVKEALQEKFKEKKISFIEWNAAFEDPTMVTTLFEVVKNETQVRCLLAFIQLKKLGLPISKKQLLKEADIKSDVIDRLVKKEILQITMDPISRIGGHTNGDSFQAQLLPLSLIQRQAADEIYLHWKEKQTVLLHGVTGSGKTRIFAEIINEWLPKDRQVLYLLPEITLATQLTQRLKAMLGEDILIYHSRVNEHERVEIWKAASTGRRIIVGPRSALFLPFCNLGLIIVDEEHDPSYKQSDPAPRYHGRDAAIMLGQLSGAKVLLGTATPSIESYTNALSGKFGLVSLKSRFGGAVLPTFEFSDTNIAMKRNEMMRVFTDFSFNALKETIASGMQAIIFQNRRGFAPIFECQTCGWRAKCIDCDTSLNYHKFVNKLKCHYCSYQSDVRQMCPDCGSEKLELKGIGTEQIEDDLKILLPDVEVKRLDLETTRSRRDLAQIIGDFESGQTNIMVGTQMVAKGLDFANVGLVIILQADKLLAYPDFRVSERAYQLLTQVSGRAGRLKGASRVIIQTQSTDNIVFDWVKTNNFESLYSNEIQQRQLHNFPPFCKISEIYFKHKDNQILEELTAHIKDFLDEVAPKNTWIYGPLKPPVSRISGYYIRYFTIKTPKSISATQWLESLMQSLLSKLYATKNWRNVKMVFNVDPY